MNLETRKPGIRKKGTRGSWLHGFQITICLALIALTAQGAITRTQAVSATANNVAITSTANNDLIIVWAYTAGSATIPTLAGGFTSVFGTAGTGQAARLAYKVSTGGDTTSGTWTSATTVVCLVYSGARTTGSPFGTTPAVNPGNGTSLTYAAGTLTVANGTSVWLGFGGASSATAGMNGTPTGTAPNFANRTNQVTSNGCDTAATASNLTAQTLTVTTTGRWATTTVELLMQPTPATITGQFFQFF